MDYITYLFSESVGPDVVNIVKLEVSVYIGHVLILADNWVPLWNFGRKKDGFTGGYELPKIALTIVQSNRNLGSVSSGSSQKDAGARYLTSLPLT